MPEIPATVNLPKSETWGGVVVQTRLMVDADYGPWRWDLTLYGTAVEAWGTFIDGVAVSIQPDKFKAIQFHVLAARVAEEISL